MKIVFLLFLAVPAFVLGSAAQGIQQQIDAVAARGGFVENIRMENFTAKNVQVLL